MKTSAETTSNPGGGQTDQRRILLICYVYPPESAPAGVMVRELAEDLAAAGHDVTVQTGWPNHPVGKLFPGYKRRWCELSRDGRHRLMRVNHAIGPKKSPLTRLWMYFTFAVSSLLNGLRLNKQDVVVCLSTPLMGVWTAWLLSWLWRARFVNVVFDLWPETILNAGLTGHSILYRLVRRVDTINLRLSHLIITLGEGLRRQIMLRGIPLEAIRIIPFWIDTQRIRPLERDNPWRRRQGLPPEQFVALFAGTIGYASGAQMLIETAENLANRPDILLLIVGEGPVKNELEVAARQKNLPNLRFLPFQPEEDLAEMQSAADVGLVTLLPESSNTSVPSKVLGYMAAGRGVVASTPTESDTAQLLNLAGCGLVVEARNPVAMAEAICSLADDRPKCQMLGQRAREYTVANLSRQAVVKQFQEAICGK